MVHFTEEDIKEWLHVVEKRAWERKKVDLLTILLNGDVEKIDPGRGW